MNLKALIFATLVLFSAISSPAHAQFNRYNIFLFDRAPSVILDSNGEFRVHRYNQAILEIEADYMIPNLNSENLTARVRKMTLTHIYNTRSGEVERSSVVLLDLATELSISLKDWKTMLVQEILLVQGILSDDEVYNTIYGRVQDGDKEVWKIIKQRTKAQ